MASFDRHAFDYEATIQRAIAFAGQPHQRFIKAKADVLLELASARLGRQPASALDIGSGTGLVDRHLLGQVGSLSGVDVSVAMVERAQKENPEVDYRTYDGLKLPYADASHDLVFAVCVLHHVEPAHRVALLSEMSRVTAPNGIVVVFEHNPWNPLTQKVVRNIDFDQGVVLLTRRALARTFRAAGLEIVDQRFMLFTPWPRLDPLERLLAWLPLGAQYVLVGQHPSANG